MPYPMAAAHGRSPRIRPTGIVDDDFSSGNLNYWTMTDVGGNITADAAAAMGGASYGMQVVIPNTTARFGDKTISSTTGLLRCRFWVDPNSLTMAANDQFWIVKGSGTVGNIFYVALKKVSADWTLGFFYINDAGGVVTSYKVITDAPHWVEVSMVRASSNVASDGTSNWWIDDVLQDAITGIDSYDSWTNTTHLQIGAVAGIDAGTSGTFYLGNVILNDTGEPIGA